MARYEFVKGLPVITMAEGRQIGKVDDLIVDPERKAVSWLRLHSGGIGKLGGKRLWVSAEAVRGVGGDAVTIRAEADALVSTDAPEALAFVKAGRGIIGAKVITEGGERLGEVLDFEFDPTTLALTSLSVPPGMGVMGDVLTIAGDKVLTIGDDVIVVATEEMMRPVVMADLGSQPNV